MDRREAKRTALFRAALTLESHLADGWPENIDNEADRDRVVVALNELVVELTRRSGRVVPEHILRSAESPAAARSGTSAATEASGGAREAQEGSDG